MTQYEVAKVVCSGLVGCAEAEDERLWDNQPSATHPASTPVCSKHSFHEETREENILVIYLLCEAFLDAIASLHLIMSVSQSVTSLYQNITKKTFITYMATFRNY